MCYAVISSGCEGSSSDDSQQQENFTEDPNAGGRGNSASTVDLSTLTEHYTARDGEILTGTLSANVKTRLLTELR